METLLKEINNILESKNAKIDLLEWEVKKLKEENEELKRKKENEVKDE